VLASLALWEIGVQRGAISALYYPPPSAILGVLQRMLASGELFGHISATLWRMLVGLLTGGGLGLVLGMLMGWSRDLRAVLDPLIAAIHPLPKIAILPLIMVIFGIGETSMILVVAMGAFFPMLINTLAGVLQIHPIHFDVARNYGASRLKIFQRVIWPGSLPLILTGLKLAINITLLLAVGVEMVSARKGLGAMIWMAWTTMRTEEIYASLLIITLMGILVNLLLHVITTKLVPWQEA
jgi:NitT/TauT family transport system permease protein